MKEFWREEGARNVEEWCAYRDYCAEIEQKNYAECCAKYPDADPEDFPIEEMYKNVPTFNEWAGR